MARIPISAIPTTYTDTQDGDTFAVDRSGVMGKITFANFFTAVRAALNVGTVQFATIAAGFARVTTTTASRFDLQATSVADTHERVRFEKNTTGYGFYTSNNTATVNVADYFVTVGAAGATAHRWDIEGAQTFAVAANAALITGAGATVLDLAATNTADTHERARLFKNTSGYGFQTVDAASTAAVTDYFATVGASGATEHSWRVGGAERLRVTATTTSVVNVYPFTDTVGTSGGPANRWAAVWSVTGTIQTSDAREKQDIAPLTDAEYRVAQRLKTLIRTYRWKANPDKKHFGVIAQEVIEAFEAEGLNWQDYGVITGGGDEPFGVNYAELHSLILGA
jgi:hypothetical protein